MKTPYKKLCETLERLETLEENAGEILFDPQEAYSLLASGINSLASELDLYLASLEKHLQEKNSP